MLRSTWIALVLGFWSSLYLVDVYLRTNKRCSEQYSSFKGRCGMQVSIGQIKFHTAKLNRLFLRLGQCKPRMLRSWFTLGSWFGVGLMFVAVALLLMTLVKAFSQDKPEQVLTPVMPGVNLPLNQITYFFAVLFISGIFHELGHAIAAVREKVRVNGFGVFIMLIYPGAYVDLHTENLQALTPFSQLRIYCAGVWHNLLLVLLGLVILMFLPYLLYPLYLTGQGVTITWLSPNSPVQGPRGLAPGYQVTSINGCPVYNTDMWTQCLRGAVFYPILGHCMPAGKAQLLNRAVKLYKGSGGQVDCCRNDSISELCFSYHLGEDADKPEKMFTCLEARPVAELPRCRKASDCLQTRKTVCLRPSLDNSSRLLRIAHNSGPPVLYVGDPYFFSYTVMVSNYVPKYQCLPLDLPGIIQLFCKYLISLSGALALLNAMPCYALDGQWILLAAIEHFLSSVVPSPSDRNVIYSLIMIFGTVILIANVVLAMLTLVTR
ncbi:membrane-bound transcription factor site-2 protease-like [Diadema antillarum]|uniref:membrane-bound transcription factor site-2 protease-like n=1 Tax=Diadema antillarum TaxID=105358 RepID=UPI003A8B19E0